MLKALIGVVFCCLLVGAYGSGLDVAVDTQTGNYSILLDGLPWFSSGSTGFYSNGKLYQTQDGSLKLVQVTDVKGEDGALGTYTGIDIEWNGGGIEFHTIFQTFSTGAIVFNQYAPKGIPSTSVNTNEDVLSAFPTLKNSTSLFFFTFANWPLTPIVGNWLDNFPSSIQGGSPAAFYNDQGRTVVFSPLNNYMIGMQTVSKQFQSDLAFGINGKVLSLDAEFTHRTILVAGQGINQTFSSWGNLLLSYSGKTRAQPDSDVLIQYLGYWTDNGAYYYYITEPNKTYSETMIDVYKYVTSTGLPIKSYQFDSWWYFKGVNGGVSLWEPMPTIFPEGMLYVDQNMGNMPLALHNRYFSPDNQYQKNYSFAIETDYALPLEEALYTYIMGKAKSWGMVLYEQDWLVTTYMGMEATQNNLTTARDWLLNMGNAAKSLGLTMQYCMPLPLHLLQSVEVQVVTQNNPGNDQWQIGYPSILPWSLGVYPFKDDFWTTSNQPGCKYSSCVEPNPVMETLVASLSSGPIGPSDSINNLNVALIMKTCTQSGLLLKADKPATTIDSAFLPQPGFTFPSLIQVWDSFTQFESHQWHYIFAAKLESEYIVRTADIGLTHASSLVFDYFAFDNGTNHNLTLFNDAHNFQIPKQVSSISAKEAAAGVVPFNYYIVAPVLQSQWVLLGEIDKFITVSHQRIVALIDTPSYLSFTISGSSSETITIVLYNIGTNSFTTLTPVFSNSEIVITCTTSCTEN